MRIPMFGSKKVDIPIREKSAIHEDHDIQYEKAALHLHPIASRDALLVKIRPPTEPSCEFKHVACDIVLVIDISGSMGARADVPGEDASESAGLSVLDLVKHAALTIIETLDEGDRLGVVTFSTKAQVVQELTEMTEKKKDMTRQKIRQIQRCDATNLWDGIKQGIEVFKKGGSSTRVPSIMLLTDGKPNHMCPPQGYVPKLKTMLPLPAAISTFAFGYNLESGLLKSIAEIGGGSYAFIPDAGMIGTVFVHAVANLQSTYATNATLELRFNGPMEIEETTGTTVDQLPVEEKGSLRLLKIPLGNLQYGQSRDLFLRVRNLPTEDPFDKEGLATVTAGISYEANIPVITPDTGAEEIVLVFDGEPDVTAACSMLADTDLPASEVDYHESRSKICAFISSIFPVRPDGKHGVIVREELDDKLTELKTLIDSLPAKAHSDERNKSLIEDLAGSEPHGQVTLALSKADYFYKWGMHYLPSLLNAHVRQTCNSFKDPGPLQYGIGSPLFIRCRDQLDEAFGNLPPPQPSLPARRSRESGGGSSTFRMSRYHDRNGVCFAGSTPVELASGRKVAVRKLRRGVNVRTPLGPRKVAAVLKTHVTEETMCRVDGVVVTPWHPISADGGKSWRFPATIAERPVCYTGYIYSVMLQRGTEVRAHGIKVGDLWGVTLGHGMVSGTDVRAHEFFGDYNRVARALIGIGMGKMGVIKGQGVERDERTGLVTGFRRAK